MGARGRQPLRRPLSLRWPPLKKSCKGTFIGNAYSFPYGLKNANSSQNHTRCSFSLFHASREGRMRFRLPRRLCWPFRALFLMEPLSFSPLPQAPSPTPLHIHINIFQTRISTNLLTLFVCLHVYEDACTCTDAGTAAP